MSDFVQPAPVPPDAWSSDRALREGIAFHLGDELYAQAEPELSGMGSLATAPETRALTMRAEREPPVHIPYSPWGERIDEIRVSSAYTELGRMGVDAGVTALPYEKSPYGEAARVVWGGLMLLWGPSSALYSCPVAMTDAAARTLLVHGGVEDVEIVQRLTTRDFDNAWTSGQWMTEMTGGSDVGGTTTRAELGDDGRWRLYGTKWFTSATTSEMALTLARPAGAGEGADGLALFRIHRRLADGSNNNIMVRRLKDKLGTRALPTAELELQGSVAHPVGEPTPGTGVRRIATMLNLTRIHNALGATGGLARGLSVARRFAQERQAFGRTLAQWPAHRATLVDLSVDYAACLALTLRCCELAGRVEFDVASEHERAILRGLTPIAKLFTARLAVAGAAEVMEAIGGVAYCEDSGIPAMVRNAHVLPIWEGTTNVLSLDLLRAAHTTGAVTALIDDIRSLTQQVGGDGALGEVPAVLKSSADELARRFEWISGDIERGQASARSFAMGVGATYACARLALQGAWAAQRGDLRTAAAARRLAARGLIPPSGPEDLELATDDQLEGFVELG